MGTGRSGPMQEPCVKDRDPNIVVSGLSRTVTINTVTVEVGIYRPEHDSQWTLEVVNDEETSTVWQGLFDTDEEAFAAFELTVEDEGMQAFLGHDNVIPFPKRR
jgi:hypothetical protein